MYHSQTKISDLDALLKKIHSWKVRGDSIVFTNGCFDILHLGHVSYLEAASRLGDRFVVGLNADASVKRLKGEDRPIQPEEARARILAVMEFVDAVVLFEEDTPQQMIAAILPDVLVKGGDYVIEDIVGYQEVTANGGEVRTIPFVAGQATTNIIEKIKHG
ncbi:MAG: D-glycero-beta-D-manno-heptose 1-phosphate adenylyltransferase [Bacteroidota bacterium]